MASDRQIPVVRGAGDRAVDLGEAAAVLLALAQVQIAGGE
jgi:hypothetical protein